MKTAEEYIPDEMPCADVWRNVIREVQLDALKEGMRMAAEVCEVKLSNVFAEADRGIKMCRDAILTTAEQLNEKDL